MSKKCVRSMIKDLAPIQKINYLSLYNICKNYRILSQFSTINDSFTP